MKEMIGQPQILREVNTAMIERLLYENGPLSKPDLARLTRLSLPTVNKLMDDLEQSGHICAVGLSGTGAGRKAMIYEINKESGYLIALYYHWGEYLSRLTDRADRKSVV